MKRAINQSLAGDVRINLDNTNSVATGLDIGFYQSMIGRLPIVPTFAIADDTSTFQGFTVSDIYLLTEKTQGQDCSYQLTTLTHDTRSRIKKALRNRWPNRKRNRKKA